MKNNADFTFWLIAEMRRFFRPLSDALKNEVAFVDFLNQYGWSPDPDSIDVIEIENNTGFFEEFAKISKGVGKMLNPAVEDNSLETYVEGIETLQSIMLKIKNLDQITTPSGFTAEMWTTFVQELLDGLTADYLEFYRPITFGILVLLGVVEETEILFNPNSDRINYTRREVNWGSLGNAILRPTTVFKDVYGWDNPDKRFQFELFFARLSRFLSLFSLPIEHKIPNQQLLDSYYSPTNPNLPNVRELTILLMGGEDLNQNKFTYSLNLLPIPPSNQFSANPNGFVILPILSVSGDLPEETIWPFSLEFSGIFNESGGVGIEVYPDSINPFINAVGTSLSSELAIGVNSPYPIILLGSIFSHRLQLSDWEARLKTIGTLDDMELVFELYFPNLQLIVNFSEGDKFISESFGTKEQILEVELKFVYSSKTGFHLEGSGSLELLIPIHLKLGIVEINSLLFGLSLKDEDFEFNLGTSGALSFGPLRIFANNVGIAFKIEQVAEKDKAGIFGDLDLGFNFKSPDSLGLTVAAGEVKGGGFLYIDEEKGEYSGVVELTIIETISLKAIGIITTKLPNGEEGYSLLLLITAEFNPMQLGFGFTLNGVGGLIGINRGMNLLAIRVGVRDNTLDNILFPEDPVANAPQIIANLNSVFPIAEGNHAFGLMFIIGWGVPALLEVELGLMISFPSFDIALIGVLSTSLPDKKKPVLVLNVAFAGTLSFENKYLFFDAQIDKTSKLLNFSLAGSMALRMLWGDDPNFILSVGGFHPDFDIPTDLGLENMDRITLSLLADDNPRLILKCYFALTSNTAQFGATIDFFFKKSKFKVVGFFYFHALFQFSPFYFIVTIGATLDVKVGSRSVLSVGVEGSLEGPTPWKAVGKGRFKIWWVKVSVSFSKTWGEQIGTSLPDIAVYPELERALLDDRSWSARLPEHSTLTTLRDTKDDLDAESEEKDALIIHPFGSLSLVQRVVPLGITIDKYGGQKPSDYKKFTVSFEIDGDDIDTNPVKDFFAPAQFFDLTDDQKISKSSYEKYNAGVSDDSESLHSNFKREKAVAYEYKRIDSIEEKAPAKKGLALEPASQLAHWAKGTAIARSALGMQTDLRKRVSGKQIRYAEEEFVIVHQGDLSPLKETATGSEFEMQSLLDELLADRPEMEDNLMAVPAYELV